MNMSLTETYNTEGFITGQRILESGEAGIYRNKMEQAEAKLGPLHYQSKVHTLLRSAWQLATLPKVIEIVKALIGPDILLHNAMYIIKEPQSSSHVSWHQDLTYWGFNDDKLVSMWLALSPANELSGSMTFLPRTHMGGIRDHQITDDPDNVLYQGQTIHNVDESGALLSCLEPGEASFHHGRVLHTSTSNRSNDRRIGFNVQYLAPSMKQTKHDRDSAILVSGEDQYHHFTSDKPAGMEIDEAAFARQQELDRQYRETAGKE